MNTFIKNSFLSAIFLFLITSCAKEIIDLNGSVEGVVKDQNTGALISNCQVSLSPGGKSTITGADGLFSFRDLEAGSYTVSFMKAGYEDASRSISVISGETSQLSIAMKAKSAFALSENKLDFGDLSSSLPLYLFNNSDESCSFTISNVPKWAVFSHNSGTVSAGNSTSITVDVSREGLDYGTFSQIVTIAYKGKTSGTVSLTLEIKKVKLTSPTVTISESAEDVKENGFSIGGEIKGTGGSEITNYGHCWSLKANPTIDDHRTDNGATKDLGSFKSVLTDLTPGTTYYVRAYATNQHGTGYSAQVAVTTTDVASSKWDGTVASSFAKGSGTSADPYVIETGAQLAHVKDYNDKYFELANNIDLDNKNWLPFAFYGKLNGKGNVILNLMVKRSTDGQGLFSEIGEDASISDLTIKNGKIEAPTCSFVGGLAGYTTGYTPSITNCKVILTEKSQITGSDYVGGLLGGCAYRGHINVSNSTVDYSGTSDDVIKGNSNVGGITGYMGGYSDDKISGCVVIANLKGEKNIGGVVGSTDFSTIGSGIIEKCSFKGKISGDEAVGGIVGYCSVNVTACKADVDLSVSKTFGGGIVGKSRAGRNTGIIACYSIGKMTSSSNEKTFGGLLGAESVGTWKYSIILCYSTISSSISNFDGIAGIEDDRFEGFEKSTYSASTSPTRFSGTNQGKCKDITTFLKECYQTEYDKYWNYSKKWTWTGTIGGSNVNVSCPKLSWE